MSTRLHIVVSDELVARVDEARGLVPRSAWLRAAVEQALSPGSGKASGPAAVKGANAAPVSPAPAEQPEEVVPFAGWPLQSDAEVKRVQRAEGVRSSSAAKRDVRPVPKKGEK